ncbi:MAG: hypothetical protein QW728_01310 [Thermoplasmata archaeon]
MLAELFDTEVLWRNRKSSHRSLVGLGIFYTVFFTCVLTVFFLFASSFKAFIITFIFTILCLIVGGYIFTIAITSKKIFYGFQYRLARISAQKAVAIIEKSLKKEGLEGKMQEKKTYQIIPLFIKREYDAVFYVEQGLFEVRVYTTHGYSVIDVGPQTLENNVLIWKLRKMLDTLISAEEKKNNGINSPSWAA